MNKLIYVAHPYGGEKKNMESVERKIAKLPKDATYVSPIHSFAYMYEKTEYFEGIDMCLDLLERCDAAYFCKGWETSKGCNIEMSFCRRNDIPIILEEEEKEEPQLGIASFPGGTMKIFKIDSQNGMPALADFLKQITDNMEGKTE